MDNTILKLFARTHFGEGGVTVPAEEQLGGSRSDYRNDETSLR